MIQWLLMMLIEIIMWILFIILNKCEFFMNSKWPSILNNPNWNSQSGSLLELWRVFVYNFDRNFEFYMNSQTTLLKMNWILYFEILIPDRIFDDSWWCQMQYLMQYSIWLNFCSKFWIGIGDSYQWIQFQDELNS